VPTTARYSLWLVPEGADEDALQAIIDRLAAQYGGPSFPPHLTLLSGIVTDEADVVERTRRLASRGAPVALHIDGIGTDETYFQSLFAVVRPTPELVGLRAVAREIFPEAPDPYRPHISLLYGHPSAETKQTIAAAERGNLPASVEARALVVMTGHEVAQWRYAVRVRLGGE
jgi:2'-5' RNA ligase